MLMGLVGGGQRKGLEETKAVFPQLRERIVGGIANLEGLLVCSSAIPSSVWMFRRWRGGGRILDMDGKAD